jgi:hypothetical protein
VRLIVVAAGGWIVLTTTGQAEWLYAVVAVGLVIYGMTILVTNEKPI